MIQIQLLEEDDVINPTDFCRPLSLEYSEFGDSIFTKAKTKSKKSLIN